MRNLLNRRGFLFGGGGGNVLGGPGGALGGVGGREAEVEVVPGKLAFGGGGGTNGTFSGGIVAFELGLGETRNAGDTEITGPGAGGVGRAVVVL